MVERVSFSRAFIADDLYESSDQAEQKQREARARRLRSMARVMRNPVHAWLSERARMRQQELQKRQWAIGTEQQKQKQKDLQKQLEHRKFEDLMAEYQELQNKYSEEYKNVLKYRKKVERQYRIVKPHATKEEIEGVFAGWAEVWRAKS